MPEEEFGPEVPEADRLEQLQEAEEGIEPVRRARNDPPSFADADADPADVLEQHREVPAGDEEDW